MRGIRLTGKKTGDIQDYRKHLLGWIVLFGVCFMGTIPTASAVPDGGYAYPELLIQPGELRTRIEEEDTRIRIIDIRKKRRYLAGHIRGAVRVWRPDIEDKNHPVPGMMAQREQIEGLLGDLGITRDSILVMYSDRYDHARLWWILAYYGFPLEQMRLLDGGIEGWKAQGYPMETAPGRVRKTRFILQERPREKGALLCTLPQVKTALHDPGSVVLDVRSKEEFLGKRKKSGAARAGRIPGVIWIEWKESVIQEGAYRGYWKSSEEIKQIFYAEGVTPEKEVYVY